MDFIPSKEERIKIYDRIQQKSVNDENDSKAANQNHQNVSHHNANQN